MHCTFVLQKFKQIERKNKRKIKQTKHNKSYFIFIFVFTLKLMHVTQQNRSSKNNCENENKKGCDKTNPIHTQPAQSKHEANTI